MAHGHQTEPDKLLTAQEYVLMEIQQLPIITPADHYRRMDMLPIRKAQRQ